MPHDPLRSRATVRMGPNSGNRVALSMKTVRATIVTPIWATETLIAPWSTARWSSGSASSRTTVAAVTDLVLTFRRAAASVREISFGKFAE
jgi:hypothetical protein